MKKMILAMAVLAYAVLFFNPNQNQVAEVSTSPIQITETVSLTSETADMSDYGIEGSHQFLAITWEEALRLFDEGGSGILFFAKSDGTESVLAAGVVNEAAKELGVHVYYVDANQSVSQETYSALSSYVSETFVQDEAGNKTFYLPNLIAVKDGVITNYHVSLLTGIGAEMTDDQHTALKNEYITVMQSAADTVSTTEEGN